MNSKLCALAVLLLCLPLQSCKRPNRFEDPEKQARYELYLKEVGAVHSVYQQRLQASNVPALQLLDAPEGQAIEALMLSDLPAKQQMQKAKPLFERLLLRSVRSNDVLTQLPGLFVTRVCLQPRAIALIKAEQTEDADVKAQIDALCGWVNALDYDFPRVREFENLADALLSIIPELETESDHEFEFESVAPQVIADALAPLLAQTHWAHSEQLLANLQLRAWSATSAAKTVAAPQEFKEFEVSGVDLVLGNFDGHYFGFETMMRIDLYSSILLSPCQEFDWSVVDESDTEATRVGKKNLQRVCRDLSLHVLQYSTSLSAIKDAFELLDRTEGNVELNASGVLSDAGNEDTLRAVWPGWVKQRHLELEELQKVELLSDARDLPELKARLRFLGEHGSMELAKQLQQGKRL